MRGFLLGNPTEGFGIRGFNTLSLKEMKFAAYERRFMIWDSFMI